MKTFLVPTDFSDTAKNAARYAVQLAAQQPGTSLVLYHIYDEIVPGSDGTPLLESDADRRKILHYALANQVAELQALAPVDVRFEAEPGASLVDNIDSYVRRKGISLVVMGITGASGLERVFMGSNALNMAREAACPVIIVPPEARFQEIRAIVLASDLKDVQTTTPVQPIKAVLQHFKPVVHLVHVGAANESEQSTEYSTERAWLESEFEDYHPQFSFIQTTDFLEGISRFADQKHIDLIITVPRRHSFLSGLFSASHTSRLAYHSHVPVVTIHE